MRLLLFLLGVFATVVCIEKSADAQNGAWCIYKSGDGYGNPQCRYATLEQCLADRLGKAGPVDPVRTRPRRNHLRQRGPVGAKRLQLVQQLRQLGISATIRRASIPAREEPIAHGPC
jgi:hypothetical protein